MPPHLVGIRDIHLAPISADVKLHRLTIIYCSGGILLEAARYRAYASRTRRRPGGHRPPPTVMHEVPIEDFIDLHTFQPREIRIVIEEYLYQAIRRGFREVRLIHGRGIGVQREIVHSMLKEHRAVISFRDAADRRSTYVLLRPGPPPEAYPHAPY